MSTITDLNAGDSGSTSRGVINDNFDALNTDKIETSVLDTDVALTANSDAKIATQKAVKAYVDGGGGTINASDTDKGLVEEATEAETVAGTATGGTGARLYVNPTHLDAYVAGVTAPVVRTYTTSGSPHTWSKPAGLKYVIVEAVGGGGGGSGIDLDATSIIGAGGGGGGYCKKLIAAGSLGTTETVTVGTGGGGGNNSGSSPTSGSAGNNTTFGSHITAGGGGAGLQTTGIGGTSGTASGGDVNVVGGKGANANSDGLYLGKGGDSQFGIGGENRGGSGNQVASSGYGAGGYGGADYDSVPASSGLGGFCIVTEYYI